MRLFSDHLRALTGVVLAMGLASVPAAGPAASPAEMPVPAGDHDFRAADWGMSRAEVRRSEGPAPDLNDGPLLAFPVTVAGQPCRVVYLFQADRLCMGFYQWSNTHDDLDLYFQDADALRDGLAARWQDPQIEKWNWEDPMFAEDPALRSEALGLGLVRYELGWMTDRSIVALRMNGGNLQGDILVMYADRRCFPSGQEAFGAFFADRVGLPSPYYR